MWTHQPLQTPSSIYLLLSAFAFALAATLPSPVALLNTSTVNSHGGSKAYCTAVTLFSPFFLTQHGCAEAINEISDAVEVGEFHIGDPFNEWSLPVSRTAGYCKVSVEMYNLGIRDRASWLQINLALTRLNMQCASKYRSRYAGGWMLTGAENEIRVAIEYQPRRGGRNETLDYTGTTATS